MTIAVESSKIDPAEDPAIDRRSRTHPTPTLASIGTSPAENDVLRDEGEAYARKLDEAGVDVTCVRYEGAIHDFALLNALREVPNTDAALRQAATELARHLVSPLG